MKTNDLGLDLIMEFEGWRNRAYKDAVGVWTIGYGHTSMAGPPEVKPNMVISKTDGESILMRDLRKYEKAVMEAVHVPLTSNQFSALVSFCYNVGPGNFLKSSVLRYTNAGRFDEVPARLLLWNKAGGRVLRGLTRRRHAEGELFLMPDGHEAHEDEMAEARALHVEQETGKPLRRSTTAWASIGSALTGGVTAISTLDPIVAGLVIVILAAFAFWVLKERKWKSINIGV